MDQGVHQEKGSYVPRHEAASFFYSQFTTFLLDALRRLGIPDTAVETARFTDGSPLVLSPVSVNHILMLMWLTGDNWEKVIVELVKAKAMKQVRPGMTEPNVSQLGIFLPYAELRQDRPSLRPVPRDVDPNGGYAVVVRQANQVKMLADIMTHVDYLVTIDPHSLQAIQSFEEAGIEVINLSAASEFADQLVKQGLVEPGSEQTVVMTSDLGSLPRSHRLAELLDLRLAVVIKKSEVTQQGTRRRVTQELVKGSVAGKKVIVFDDMISSASTIIGICQLAFEKEATEVIVCATHPVLVADYYNNIKQLLRDPRITVVVGNTLPLTDNGNLHTERLGRRVSVPYNSFAAGEATKRYMEILDLQPFMLKVVIEALAAGDLNQLRESLATHILDLVDPYALYTQLVGEELPRPEITHVYLPGGEYMPVEEYRRLVAQGALLTESVDQS